MRVKGWNHESSKRVRPSCCKQLAHAFFVISELEHGKQLTFLKLLTCRISTVNWLRLTEWLITSQTRENRRPMTPWSQVSRLSFHISLRNLDNGDVIQRTHQRRQFMSTRFRDHVMTSASALSSRSLVDKSMFMFSFSNQTWLVLVTPFQRQHTDCGLQTNKMNTNPVEQS